LHRPTRDRARRRTATTIRWSAERKGKRRRCNSLALIAPYVAELTPLTGDYGADLILIKDGQRIAVQAKRYVGSVGVSAVQEALSGQAYYQCDTAWVVTTGAFTTNALELAKKSGVKLIGRSDIGNLMAQHKAKTNNG